MGRLGYARYGAQGGDWGSAVTCVLGESHPDHVQGIHVNMPTVGLEPLPADATLFSKDQLLDNVSVYWFTATGASSARLYWERASPAVMGASGMTAQMGAIMVPTACSVFPREIRRPSRRQAEQRFVNIHDWNEPTKGGHFAAFEQPEIFVEEVRAGFRSLR